MRKANPSQEAVSGQPATSLEDPYILQRLALATYKSQYPTPEEAFKAARDVLKLLEPQTSNDTETLGLWGSLHKGLWKLTKESSYLDEAVRAYERSHKNRAGANLYANTLLALDAATGRRLWHFQTVHHDVWDRDLPAAPNLLRVKRGLRSIEAVAQITKSGFVFLFDRVSGAPLFAIDERPVPRSDLAGESSWPTQPYPTRPAPFARQRMTESDVTNITASAHDSALARFRTLKTGSLFAPPSREGTIVLPGFDGGGEWGGSAVDPETATLFVNASDVPWIARMRETVAMTSTTTPRTGAQVYAVGNSSLLFGAGSLVAQTGVVEKATSGGWAYFVTMARPAVPGDSGSGYLDARGRALDHERANHRRLSSALMPCFAAKRSPNRDTNSSTNRRLSAAARTATRT